MAMWTTLASLAGVHRNDNFPTDGEPPQNVAPGQATGSSGLNPRRFGKFQPLFDTLEGVVRIMASEEIAGHRGINPRFLCKVNRIEIEPLNEAAALLLDDVLKVHGAQVIADRLRDMLKLIPFGNCFDFTTFAGVVARKQAGAPSDEDDELAAELRASPTGPGDFRIDIFWDPGQETAPPPSPPPPPPEDPVSATVAWRLTDAQGSRAVAIPRRGQVQAVILGKEPSCDVPIDGRCTSGRHGALWYEQGTWWYGDLESKNGSRVIQPGQAATPFPGRESGRPAHKPVALLPGCRIVFTETQEGSPTDYPVLELPAGNGRHTGTPGAEPIRAPIAPPAEGPRPEGVIARLLVEDADGLRELPLLSGQLPFDIGRAPHLACPVPRAHETVSRRHLSLLTVTAAGARIRMLGEHGGECGGQTIAKGKERDWPWNAPLLLGAPAEAEPRLRLILLRPSGA